MLDATTTFTQLGNTSSSVFNTIMQLVIQMLNNSTLVTAFVLFGIVYGVWSIIKRRARL